MCIVPASSTDKRAAVSPSVAAPDACLDRTWFVDVDHGPCARIHRCVDAQSCRACIRTFSHASTDTMIGVILFSLSSHFILGPQLVLCKGHSRVGIIARSLLTVMVTFFVEVCKERLDSTNWPTTELRGIKSAAHMTAKIFVRATHDIFFFWCQCNG